MNNKIINLYSQGNSIYTIAQTLGIAPSTVWYKLKKLNVKIDRSNRIKSSRALKKIKPHDIEEIKNLYNQGWTQKSIALKYNLSQPHISLILHKYKERSYYEQYPKRMEREVIEPNIQVNQGQNSKE